MYVCNDIACSTAIVFSYETGPVQMVCLYSQPENLLFITIYRIPDDSAHGHPSRLKNTIPKFIIVGDFNLPYMSWPGGGCKPGASNEERLKINVLNELCNGIFLHQIVHVPIHKDGNTLDLVFTNNLDLIQHASSLTITPKHFTPSPNQHFNKTQIQCKLRF